MGASFGMRAVEALLRFERKTLHSADKTRARLTGRAYPTHARPPRSLHRTCDISDSTFAGHPAFTVRPRHSTSPATILYTHGGCYVNNLIGAHWSIVRALALSTGATVCVPVYPLAPEHTHDAAFAMLAEVRRTLSGPLVLAGDSAGGGLAVAQHLLHEDAALLLLIAPWLDITLADPAAAALERTDIMLGIDGMRVCGEMWAGAADPRAVHLSPLFADLRGLPPTHVFQGTHDILLPDARAFVDAARAAGVDAHMHEYPGAFHVFMGAPFLRESRDAFAIAARAVAALG
jgi:acetyl esterase/lipase